MGTNASAAVPELLKLQNDRAKDLREAAAWALSRIENKPLNP
jgi:hypothetical protein